MIKKVIYIILIGVIVITATSIVLSITKGKKANSILSLKCIYSFVYQDEDKIMDVPYYINSKVNNFKNLKQIEEIYLLGEDFKMELTAYDLVENGIHTYNKEKYYGYVLRLYVPKYDIDLDTCYLELISSNDKIKLEIGSFYSKRFNNINNDLEISIDEIYGIISPNLETPEAVILKIYNKTNKLISLEDFMIGNIALIDKGSIKEIDLSTNYESKTNIEEILGYKYDMYGSVSQKVININVAPYDSIKLILPIKYLKNAYLYQAPVITKYNNKYHIMSEFMFYDNHFDLSLYQKVVVVND